MTTVKVTDGSQYLAQLSGDGRLSRSGITCQDDVHRHLLLFAQATLGTLHGILYRIGHLTDCTLHLVHANIPVEIFQDILNSPLFRHIALDVITLHLGGIGSTADELGEDILGSLIGQVAVAEEFIFDLNLVFEKARELVICFLREFGDAIFRPQVHLTDFRQLVIARSWQTEGVLETVRDGRVTLEEVLQTFRQTRDDHDGIILPLVHLHEQLIQRIHLIGILVWQELLNIIEEQNAALSLSDIIVPFVHKPLIVNSVDHRQFRLLYDLMFVEIVTEDLGKHSLTCSRFTYDDSVDGDPDFGDILTGLKVGIGVDDRLQLLLHLVKTYQTVQQILSRQRSSAPLAELRYASVFLMTILTNHYSTSFSNWCNTFEGEILI